MKMLSLFFYFTIGVGLIASVVITSIVFRYDYFPGASFAVGNRLDRWTGEVRVCLYEPSSLRSELNSFRIKFPVYDDIADEPLMESIRNTYYANMSVEQFADFFKPIDPLNLFRKMDCGQN